MASGLYVASFRDALGSTGLALDFDSETQIYVALMRDTLTPNFTTDTTYANATYTTPEVPNGSGYTTGGIVLTGTSIVASGGSLVFDATLDPSWATATITARSILGYANTLAGDNLMWLTEFSQNYTSTNGTFQVTWGCSIWTLDLTP